MQGMSRWIPAIAGLCFMGACSDSQPTTAPAVLSAEVVTPCQAELDALRSAINAASFTGRKAATDQANLLAKVDEAEAKLLAGKPADAVRKLENIRATVVALSMPDANGSTKLDATGAAAITSAIDGAEACIQSV